MSITPSCRFDFPFSTTSATPACLKDGVAISNHVMSFGISFADVKSINHRGMQHSACIQEFDDVESFLVSRLASDKA